MVGVEEVETDVKHSKVTVKGRNAHPLKVLERLRKKYGKNVELISPIPKPQESQQEKKEDKEQVSLFKYSYFLFLFFFYWENLAPYIYI